jgi:quercetin dioxygenase-like cupin family protein
MEHARRIVAEDHVHRPDGGQISGRFQYTQNTFLAVDQGQSLAVYRCLLLKPHQAKASRRERVDFNEYSLGGLTMSKNVTVHRPQNMYLTELTGGDDDFCAILCTFPAGGYVPIHSHADREIFYIISGEIEGLNVNRWQTLRAGDVFDVRDGLKHAWRNFSDTDAVMFCVTTNRIGRFLQEISRPAADAESAVQRFVRLCHEHGYWLGSPDDNAAVGLSVPIPQLISSSLPNA